MNYMQYVEIGKWKGLTNYECKLCPYATVQGVGDILAHLSGAHFKTPPPEPAVLRPINLPQFDEEE